MRRLLALLPIFLILAGCGGGGPGRRWGTTGDDQMQTETSQTITTAPGYQTVRFGRGTAEPSK